MRCKLIPFAAVALNAAAMSAPAPDMAASVPTRPLQAVWQMPEEPCAGSGPAYALLVSQQTPVPLRWPQFPREPEPRPLPQQAGRGYPGSSLGWSNYGRSPDDGTSTTYRIWPRSGRIYPPPYDNPSPPEPVRWPEYRR